MQKLSTSSNTPGREAPIVVRCVVLVGTGCQMIMPARSTVVFMGQGEPTKWRLRNDAQKERLRFAVTSSGSSVICKHGGVFSNPGWQSASAGPIAEPHLLPDTLSSGD